MEELKVIDKRHPEEPEVLTMTPVGHSPADMMQMAITGGIDLDKLEKFMELQERHEAREAKKAYVQAMADFKANPPTIEKNRRVFFEHKNDEGNTDYWHADLAQVTEKINAGLSQHGLSAAWETAQSDGKVSVTCKITHKLGHSEQTTLFASPDASGKKNNIQQIASTITYLERYTLLALTGLATKGQDDDGVGGEPEYISKEQVQTITALVEKKGVDVSKFLEYMGVEETTLIMSSDFNKAITALNAAKGKQREPGEEG